MRALVGYTGFVGSNIFEQGNFEAVYHSKNIMDSYGTKPDLLVYAGLRAEKYLANSAPKRDMELILQAEENICKIAPHNLVLISTIDIFKNPKKVDERSEVEIEGLHAYGYNRYQLELWVRKHFPNALIIRLPGLFGKNIKKNFIFDFINRIPSMLKEDKYRELLEKSPLLKDFYTKQENGFYKVCELNAKEKEFLKGKFKELGFSALNFTDSRSLYQFYPLSRLWSDIQVALECGIKLWHPATEPISAGELYYYLTGERFINELPGNFANYDYQTIYSEVFHGKNGYIIDKISILDAIKEFVADERRNCENLQQ